MHLLAMETVAVIRRFESISELLNGGLAANLEIPDARPFVGHVSRVTEVPWRTEEG